MTMTEFIDENWVALLLAGMSFWYAYRLLKRHEIEAVRPKKAPALAKKKRIPYADEAGKLMLINGIAFSGIVIVRLLTNGVVALLLTLAAFLYFAVNWKRVFDKYER